jgi:hypothetical protein
LGGIRDFGLFGGSAPLGFPDFVKGIRWVNSLGKRFDFVEG